MFPSLSSCIAFTRDKEKEKRIGPGRILTCLPPPPPGPDCKVYGGGSGIIIRYDNKIIQLTNDKEWVMRLK
jgi:hypothetical protein